MNPTSPYATFFTSVTDDTRSTSNPSQDPQDLDAPPAPSPQSTTTTTTNDDETRQSIDQRRTAYLEKARTLRHRIAAEKAKLEALKQQWDAQENPDNALFRHISRTRGLLESVRRNYNVAVDEHKGSQGLSEVGMLGSKVLEIERRLRAVEVALQGGVEGEGVVGESEGCQGGELRSAVAANRVLGSVGFDLDTRLFDMEDVSDPGENLPPVGYFRV